MIQTIDSARRPLDVLAHWPDERPVLVLNSGGTDGPGWSPRWRRWSILAQPERWFAVDAATTDSGDPLDRLDAVLEETRLRGGGSGPDLPFVGGWIGSFGYELGRAIEPAAGGATRRRDDAGGNRWPLIELAWCPGALLFDHAESRWYRVGDADPGPLLHAGPPDPSPSARLRLGPWRSSLDADAYLAAVARTLAYIRAGDVFQANVTQRLSASMTGSVRDLARRGLERSDAWYGAFLELPGDRALVSMSPELFLEVDGEARTVCTRPIKGTRPARVDRRELVGSAKDAAELHMIVDLMRNDLGRVCRYGSVRVPSGRTVETHGTVHHGVGEVLGTLRDDVTMGDLLRATFPPGSVTGAPKIRAMQIIDELEPVARGPYCGAVGFISDHGDACLNVAIRTMVLTGARDAAGMFEGTVDYAVGGGIVADSEPLAEYRESLDKAAVLRLVLANMVAGTGTDDVAHRSRESLSSPSSSPSSS